MSNTKIITNTSVEGVLPAVADFICRHGKEAIAQAPEDFQDMFNNLMDTAHGDSLEYRQRLLGTLIVIRDFSNALSPFSSETIHKALAHL